MGCDIHSFAEIKKEGKWYKVEDKVFSDVRSDKKTEHPFDWRSYGVFGFLSNVYNKSLSGYISETKGFPSDSEYLNGVSEYAYDVNPLSGEVIPIEEREKVKQELMDSGYWGFTYLTLKELLDWDYEKTFENR